MKYIPCTNDDERQILNAIGIETFEDLIDIIPKDLRIKKTYDLNNSFSELELIDYMKKLSQKNDTGVCFLGSGSYDRYVPTVIDFIASRSEFYTAYTPYQPEVSQGTLQYIYEYQSMICELTGMDYSNASLYDGASALSEACILSSGYNSRNKILISSYLNPSYKDVLKTCMSGLKIEIEEIPSTDTGMIDFEQMINSMSADTSCVVVQSPNYHGQIEDLAAIRDKLDKEIILISVNDPISLGLLKRPGDLGADIYVGEGQQMGNYLSFGGPYLGIIAVKEKYLRRIPGRIVGKTEDMDGSQGFVLTLQTREQHIRRERATSNICTNQGLMALRAVIYLSIMGGKGLAEINKLSINKTYYLADKISELNDYTLMYKNNFINEILIKPLNIASEIIDQCQKQGYYLELIDKEFIKIAVTEKRTKAEIDGLINIFKSLN